MNKVILLACLSCWSSFCRGQDSTSLRRIAGFQGIVGKVIDLKSGRPLPSRIEIYNEAGKIQESYYRYLPGLFTGEDGTFRLALQPGKYTLKATRGFDYQSQQHFFEITGAEGVEAFIALKPWLSLKEMGWINGEGHAHLYTETKPDREMLAGVRKICRAQGIDFVCAAQGWAGANDSTWRKEYGAQTDRDFSLYYGAEMPKYRTGHTFWFGLESTKNSFPNAIDTMYEKRYYQSATATHWDFKSLPFTNFPDVEWIPRWSRAQNAVAVVAHPTRWWMQEREHSIKYTTNAAANLAFRLLAGDIPDGLVIMGDLKDNYPYQNLWFNILNLGYRIPAMSELDGGYLPEFRFPYGLMRTYFQVEPNNSDRIQGVVDAVRQNKTFVTTGPIVLSDIDGKYSMGDILPTDGTSHMLHLDAYASGDTEDRLSYVIVFRNGRILKYWDLRNESIRRFHQELSITEKEKAWYVIKVYGKKTWPNPDNLDVMATFSGMIKEEQPDRDVCITSPFYFLPKGEEKPNVLLSDVSLTVISPVDSSPVEKGELQIYWLGEKINTIALRQGAARFTMPINAVIKIMADNRPPIYRSLYLDFEPHRTLLEGLANGDWRAKSEYNDNVYPGYIPWKEFHFEETKQLLRKVTWRVILEQNETDKGWDHAERVLLHP